MSATCEDCGQEMNPGASCSLEVVVIDGHTYERDMYHGSRQCHDCNAGPGGVHHFGCNIERCPVCDGQFIACGHGGRMKSLQEAEEAGDLDDDPQDRVDVDTFSDAMKSALDAFATTWKSSRHGQEHNKLGFSAWITHLIEFLESDPE
jgi:hypothetical protein